MLFFRDATIVSHVVHGSVSQYHAHSVAVQHVAPLLKE